ncbi:phage tail assembly chaperone [Euryhalocaulis caribicus]|uniref:phage tail assembly chaperone n=1 Tax=Euryhalocaulis caribicus TaxID=1161401 RepID=UPI0003AA947B|nr:phage tail assembly chaperone [Euryhalocaulis caribicus]
MNAVWRGALRAAAGMGLTPEAFWRLSVAEWRALNGEGGGLKRAAFEALAARFPDKEDQGGE